ncbi:MAG: hypothetical protein ACI4TA_06475 [Acetatifactor sp.]
MGRIGESLQRICRELEHKYCEITTPFEKEYTVRTLLKEAMSK